MGRTRRHRRKRCITAHLAALANGGFSKPSRVLSLYTGTLQEEDATGRFHASIAFTRDVFDSAGGWLLTKRGDFDQQLLARLSRASETVDPHRTHPPSYVFRWGSTGAYHGQALMHGTADEQWYDRTPNERLKQSILRPASDRESALVFDARY